MLASPDQSVLLIIDMQPKLIPAIEDHAHVLSNVSGWPKLPSSLIYPSLGQKKTQQALGKTTLN